jgi:hypothetical protein
MATFETRTIERLTLMFSLVLCLAASTSVARAQAISATDIVSGTAATETPSDPIQSLSITEFNQLDAAGQLSVPDRSALNHAVVEKFMQGNPAFARFVGAVPIGADVVPTPDGNYLVPVSTTEGTSKTVVTMGQEAILAEIADSLLVSSDPVQQLALYQSLYTQYTGLYDRLCGTPSASPEGCGNLTPPSQLTDPSALENASLGVLKSALQSVGALGNQIARVVPDHVPSTGLASCSADVGNNSSLTDTSFYGDQTLGRDNKTGKLTHPSGCTIPSSVGILANFDWQNKDKLTCVKAQGQRETCHIFAATSAVEEMIGIDTGTRVNLSEQDFMEHEKGVWHQEYHHGGGNPKIDLLDAAHHNYQFPYEDQWDYNPQYEVDFGTDMGTCKNYPTPPEPGCSGSAPEEPEFCLFGLNKVKDSEACPLGLVGFIPATLRGAPSPYKVNAAAVGSLWDPSADAATKDGYVGLIKISLLSDNAVILALNLTPKFGHPKNGYIDYDPSDTKKSTGGHVVHLVGYIDNGALASNPGTNGTKDKEKPLPGAGGGYFIIKNSWGPCTGDVGYEYMPVQYLKDKATGVTVLSSIAY